ncbi:MAG: hypothetical protein ACRC1H_13665, partial [Caldilineaceae bacterium]
MVFKPADAHERWEGLVLCFWILILDMLLLQWIFQRETDWLLFSLIFVLVISLVALAHLAYRTWTAFTLEYWVDRNALNVRWADVRQQIPLSAIRRIVLGAEFAGSPPVWRNWPSPWVLSPDSPVPPAPLSPASIAPAANGGAGEGDEPAWNPLLLLATRRPADCLVLETDTRAFALSPAATEPFIEALQERVRMGPASSTPFVYERRYDPVRLLTADRTGILLLVLGLLGGLLLFGALMVRFPGLPDALAVRYTAEGVPEQVREKGTLFLLPAIGLMAWLVNGVWGL